MNWLPETIGMPVSNKQQTLGFIGLLALHIGKQSFITWNFYFTYKVFKTGFNHSYCF